MTTGKCDCEDKMALQCEGIEGVCEGRVFSANGKFPDSPLRDLDIWDFTGGVESTIEEGYHDCPLCGDEGCGDHS